MLAIVDQNDDLKFDIDAPKKGTAREICFTFGDRLEPDGPGSLDRQTICGGPLWNTRGVNVELSGMIPDPDQSAEFGSRFIVSPGNGFEYKVRYGAEPVCGSLSLGERLSSVSVTAHDNDGDELPDSWTLNATGRVAFVSAHDTKLKGKSDPGFVCVGTYVMSWTAYLVKN